MTADKMFEKLGYTKFKRTDDKKYIRYRKGDTTITFDLMDGITKIWAEKLQAHLLSFDIYEIKAIAKFWEERKRGIKYDNKYK